MKEADIVLALLPQSNGLRKHRPALVLRQMPGFGDLLVCGVSTQLRQEVAGFDQILDPSQGDFKTSGLKAPSLIRLGFLAVLPVDHFLGTIGAISDKRHQLLLARLCDYLRTQRKL